MKKKKRKEKRNEKKRKKKNKKIRIAQDKTTEVRYQNDQQELVRAFEIVLKTLFFEKDVITKLPIHAKITKFEMAEP